LTLLLFDAGTAGNDCGNGGGEGLAPLRGVAVAPAGRFELSPKNFCTADPRLPRGVAAMASCNVLLGAGTGTGCGDEVGS
jgi:hypothetical protein